MAHLVVWEKFGFCCTYSGRVTFDDFLQVHAEVNANHEFDQACYAIFDFLKVTSHTITCIQAEEMAGLHYAQDLSNSRLYRVAVATDPSAIALINAWMAVHPNPEKIGLCSSVEEARQWILHSAILSPEGVEAVTGPAPLME